MMIKTRTEEYSANNKTNNKTQERARLSWTMVGGEEWVKSGRWEGRVQVIIEKKQMNGWKNVVG